MAEKTNTSTTSKALDYKSAYVTIGDYDGHAIVVRGHEIDPATISHIAAAEHLGTPVVTEVFWDEHKRVMWCDRIDGFGCDNNGEWHRHWSEIKPNADISTHFTVIHRGAVPEPIERRVGWVTVPAVEPDELHDLIARDMAARWDD